MKNKEKRKVEGLDSVQNEFCLKEPSNKILISYEEYRLEFNFLLLLELSSLACRVGVCLNPVIIQFTWYASKIRKYEKISQSLLANPVRVTTLLENSRSGFQPPKAK